MGKRLKKAQRTERKCMFCDELFIPKKGSYGMFCKKLCASTSSGYRVARANRSLNYDYNTPEEHRINYDESLDKGDYEF